jgi:hypothetical protein
LWPTVARGLIEQTVAGGAGVPDDQSALPHTLLGTCEVDAVREHELDQQPATERHVRLGAGRGQLSGVVVR